MVEAVVDDTEKSEARSTAVPGRLRSNERRCITCMPRMHDEDEALMINERCAICVERESLIEERRNKQRELVYEYQLCFALSRSCSQTDFKKYGT